MPAPQPRSRILSLPSLGRLGSNVWRNVRWVLCEGVVQEKYLAAKPGLIVGCLHKVFDFSGVQGGDFDVAWGLHCGWMS
jgi:hypothetical protein